MSVCGQRARELVTWYDLSLEQQIVGGGSSLVCKDEELWKKVEGFLREGDALETHCLGVDPLEVMEESLKATATPGHERRRARGGLEALAKAFEVLEQAALNLYLGPWREEYKVLKMHSGMFTHYIKPVLSAPQIDKLFGLLGYRHCSAPHEQLRLQPPAVTSAAAANLLHLSCSFFLARCECRLLLSALGRRGGEAQWELSLVGERRRGHSLQAALDHTKKLLEVNQPPKEDVSELAGADAGLYLDLYTDEQVNGGHREKSVDEDESPKSFTWLSRNSTSPTDSGMTSVSVPREPGRGSAPKYQQSKTSQRGSSGAGSFSTRTKQGRHSCEESPRLAFDKADSKSRGLNSQAMGVCKSELSPPSEAKHVCGCVQSRALCLGRCVECDALHDVSCASLQHCLRIGHSVPLQDQITEDADESRAASSLSVLSSSPTLATASSGLSHGDLDLDVASQVPIAFHDCCDLAYLDPRALCSDCWVFHAAGCRGAELCRKHHEIRPLTCCWICKGPCERNPLVLCRYCGAEYCSECWYRHPVVCTCGQTFDQSSSV